MYFWNFQVRSIATFPIQILFFLNITSRDYLFVVFGEMHEESERYTRPRLGNSFLTTAEGRSTRTA